MQVILKIWVIFLKVRAIDRRYASYQSDQEENQINIHIYGLGLLRFTSPLKKWNHFRSLSRTLKHNLDQNCISMSTCKCTRKKWFYWNHHLWILNPYPYSWIIMEGCRSNFIYRWMTCNRYDSISVAFKFLNHRLLLKIPQVNTIIFWSTDNVFTICHGKCGWYAEYFVNMTSVYL